MCRACYAEDGLDDGSNWIGCNLCPCWYHKTCLSLDLEEKSDDAIATFDFICNICAKYNKRCNRTKKNKSN